MSIADINKLTIEDIRTMSPTKIRSLSDSELRRATQVMMNAANKRVSRMMASKEGQYSPIAEQGRKAAATGEKAFTLKGAKSRSQVKAQFDQMRNWLDPNKKSHTVQGWKNVYHKTVERVGKEMAKDPNFWEAFRKVEKDFNGQYPGGYDSFEVQRICARIIGEGGSISDVERFMMQAYESEQSSYYAEMDEDFDEWDDDFEEW